MSDVNKAEDNVQRDAQGFAVPDALPVAPIQSRPAEDAADTTSKPPTASDAQQQQQHQHHQQQPKPPANYTPPEWSADPKADYKLEVWQNIRRVAVGLGSS